MYVKNEEGFIYEVSFNKIFYDNGSNIIDNSSYIELKLTLVCGVDYVSENEDIQNYVSYDRFIDDIQEEYIVVYITVESIIKSLEENGYKIIEKLPKIY